jgi:hypothetical protein
MDFNVKLFNIDGKAVTCEDLMKKIYLNSEEKTAQIQRIVDHLRDQIRNTGDASVMAPWIAEYLSTAVKNDDNLIKLFGIISRLLKTKSGNSDEDSEYELTDAMKRDLLSEVETILKKS